MKDTPLVLFTCWSIVKQGLSPEQFPFLEACLLKVKDVQPVAPTETQAGTVGEAAHPPGSDSHRLRPLCLCPLSSQQSVEKTQGLACWISANQHQQGVPENILLPHKG